MKLLLLGSGWAIAAWLGYSQWQACQRHHCPTPPAQAGIQTPLTDPLQEKFRAWSAQPQLAGTLLACCVLDEQGKVVFASPLAETALCPASALKTATTGAALELLGPEFRFTTRLAGELDAAGTVQGDLVLIGGGDPTLSIDDLNALVDGAVKRGMKKITGSVRVDTSVFPATAVSDHWNWGDIGNAYGAGAFGVNLEHNRMSVRFSAGTKEGDAAKLLGSAPKLPETEWDNQVITGPAASGDRVVIYSQPYGKRLSLGGSVPLGESDFAVGAAIPDPPALAAHVLRERLQQAGVTVLGRNITASPRPQDLATHASDPLPEIIDHLHRVSDNLEAQCLFLTLGNLKQTDPVTALREYWQQAGVDTKGWRLLDGNGLARANMIRPIDLARINHAARHAPHGDRFLQSLSRYDGGTTRSKLGAMSGVKTEAGFLTLPNGRELTFCLMANGLIVGGDYWKLRTQWLEALTQDLSSRS